MKNARLITRRSRRFWLIISAVLVILLLTVMVINRHWFYETYYRIKVEDTVREQIAPLRDELESMGFKNLDELDTNCGVSTFENHMDEQLTDYVHPAGGTFFECSSNINGYTKLPTDAAGINNYKTTVAKLHTKLVANGWKSREDYPTIPWFNKILSGVDYQPDQLNQKKVGDFSCVIDFFTAFSKQYEDSKDPAASLNLYCTKPDDSVNQLN